MKFKLDQGEEQMKFKVDQGEEQLIPLELSLLELILLIKIWIDLILVIKEDIKRKIIYYQGQY